MCRQQFGSSLLEIIFALFLVGMTASGSLHLLTISVKTAQEVSDRTQAQTFAMAVVERLRGNAAAWRTYETRISTTSDLPETMPETVCDTAASCSVERMAAAETSAMKLKLKSVLPHASMALMPCEKGKALVCLFIGWQGVAATSCQDAEKAQYCLNLVVDHVAD